MNPEELLALWLADLDSHQAIYVLSESRVRVPARLGFFCRHPMWQEVDAQDPSSILVIHGSEDGEACRRFPVTLDSRSGFFRNGSAIRGSIHAWLDEVHAYEEEVAS